jgi:peptidyl-prolyl cis-trans isomerase B (cyclophilin B)
MQNPLASIIINGSTVLCELCPEEAPNTVNNFIALANSGYYDGLIFHRVIDGFMIQGGDPAGTGTGGPGYCIKGEFKQNGVLNEISHLPGVLSMARTPDPDSAGSQFFIMVGDGEFLDGQYAAFGRVTEGMEQVYAVAKCDTDAADRPRTKQVIESIRVELFDQEYPEPEKV